MQAKLEILRQQELKVAEEKARLERIEREMLEQEELKRAKEAEDKRQAELQAEEEMRQEQARAAELLRAIEEANLYEEQRKQQELLDRNKAPVGDFDNSQRSHFERLEQARREMEEEAMANALRVAESV